MDRNSNFIIFIIHKEKSLNSDNNVFFIKNMSVTKFIGYKYNSTSLAFLVCGMNCFIFIKST